MPFTHIAANVSDEPNTHRLFTQALSLSNGWEVTVCQLDTAAKKLTLEIDFQRGQRFACPKCGAVCPVHDTQPRSWRHMNFFSNECHMQARVPRIRCHQDGILQVPVPWAQEGSGFTLAFEAIAVLMSQQMSLKEAAQQLGIEDTRLARIVKRHVDEARAKLDWSGVERICVDEVSARSGQRYVTNFLDADTRALLFMAEGRSAETFKEFIEELRKHGGDPLKIKYVSIDMSAAYIKGVREALPNAQISFDRYHVMALAGEALEETRKDLQSQGADLKGAMWALRGNEWNLSEEYKTLRKQLCDRYPKLGKAMGQREMLQDILATGDESDLKWWCRRAKLSRLEPFKKLARTIEAHWEGIVVNMKTGLNNGAMEAVNGVLQLIKRIARGFRTFTMFATIAYLRIGKLRFDLPDTHPPRCRA